MLHFKKSHHTFLSKFIIGTALAAAKSCYKFPTNLTTRTFYKLRFSCAVTAILLTVSCSLHADEPATKLGSNPIFRDAFTADPAPLVVGDTLYVYAGRDEAMDGQLFNMTEWLCYSTKDMINWTAHGSIMKPTDFKWASRDAWAAQVVENKGKFYLYTTVHHGPPGGGKAIGVAVSDSPTGPFKDARGSALIIDTDTPGPYGWDDIDPTVFVDDDGTAWLAWGNPNCHLVKLKSNMTEIDGPIQKIHVPNYTEGPWLNKRKGLYYLFYPAFAHQGMGEMLCYATAKKITGPWTYQGILTGNAEKSYTIHPGIVDFKGQSYLFYHNATLTLNGQNGALGRRSVCVEYLFYNPDGSIQPIRQTKEGVSVPPKPDATFPRTSFRLTTSSSALPGPGADIKLTQQIESDPRNWPETPLISTVKDPYAQATKAVSFNAPGQPTSLGQIFKMDSDLLLEKIMLYAGDGFGTTEEEPVTLALYDLGQLEMPIETYEGQINLLGNQQVTKIAYQPQPRGLLQIDFSKEQRVKLQKGHVYAFELQGKSKSAPLFWRRSTKSASGGAYSNRIRLKDGENYCDFALAIYGQ